MKQYWLSMLVQDKLTDSIWCLAVNDSALSLEQAIQAISYYAKSYTVLSAWVDTFDERGVKTVVFHECYIGMFGEATKKWD